MHEEFKVGEFRVAVKLNRISQNGHITRVEPKVMQVLARLAERPGEVVPKDELLETVWADTHVTDEVLTGCISTLRRVFGDNPRQPSFIETIPKSGYRLIAPVEFTANQSGSAAAEKSPAVPPVRHATTWWLLGAVLIALLGGGWLWHSTRLPAIESVAILPFANSSADPNAEYLSDGISESIIDSISQLPNLRVMAWSTVSRYKGKSDPIAVGRDLGVRAVLTGQILQRDDQVVIQTELVDLKSGTQLWGEQYNRKASDIIPLQQDIARQISEKLRLRLSGEDERKLGKRSTADPEAYRLYLKGRYFWNKRTQDDLKKAMEYFQQAIDRDPTYAAAYAGLADSYDLLDDWGKTPPRESFPRARAAALKALQLDDSLAEAHTSLAFVKANYDWDFAGGDGEFKRAIELNPNYATAHQWYAMQLVTEQRFPEAEAEMRRAVDLDPLSVIINMGVAEVSCWERKYDQCLAEYKKTLELDPNFVGAHGNIAALYERKRMYPEAVEELEKTAQLQGNPGQAAMIAKVYAKSGFEGVRRMELQELLADRAAGRYVPALNLAESYMTIGDKESALRWLQTGYDERDSGIVFIGITPEYDSVRQDPRFLEIAAKAGLPQK
ncbi:MAG TPA: winged helix-turn-helix domain-containing protein [Terriglobales bacterium]|nr:winged helix-turn-helix domain-containing protein [Terriglobales bacterium]